MGKYLKIRTLTDEWNKINYYKEFEILKELPIIEKLEDLKEIKMNGYYDCYEAAKDYEQSTVDAYLAECFVLKYFDYFAYENSILDEESEYESIDFATEFKCVAIIREI